MQTEIQPRAPHAAHSCWKAADLRGAYPAEISPELFTRIGAALGTTLVRRARVLVAGDFRLSTPALKDALCKGLVNAGANVLDAGQIPTPVAYFAARRHQPDAVLIVTASHNPPADNGLKLLLEGKPPTPAQLVQLRELTERGGFRSGHGSLTRVQPVLAYERFMHERWQHLDPALLPEVILDAGNGAWSEIAPRICAALRLQVRCISCEIDGNFPDRPSDCSRPANLRQLRELNAIGIAWDGDGDRVAAIDETGRAVSADELSMLMTRASFASAAPQSGRVVIDLKLASSVEREVKRLGGAPLLEQTGHAFMRTRMIATEARLGLDACGHFFFGELAGADDGLFAALTLLDWIQRSQSSLSALRSSLPPTYSSPELRIPRALLSFDHAAQALLAAFPEASIDRLDGIRMSLHLGTILLRESGTEPMLSLRMEGLSAESYTALLARCLDTLPAARSIMQAQIDDHSVAD
jgi:phosphomannomutase/phosphoglucomutase